MHIFLNNSLFSLSISLCHSLAIQGGRKSRLYNFVFYSRAKTLINFKWNANFLHKNDRKIALKRIIFVQSKFK